MWDYCGHSLDVARLRGATYADVRVMHLRHRDLTTKSGEVGTLGQSESIGLGIRVVVNGAWGCAHPGQLAREGVAACAAQAVSIAKASALAKKEDVQLAAEPSYVDSWQGPCQKDPFEIPLEAQIDLLLKADAAMRQIKGVTLTETDMQFRKIDSWFASSAGSKIHQRRYHSGCGIVATSFKGDAIQKRSYPNSFGGQHILGGSKLIEAIPLLKHAPQMAEDTLPLPPPPHSPHTKP